MELLPYEELMRAMRKKRKKLGVQQKELASRADVRPSHLNRMERGKSEAKYSTVHRVWEELKYMEDDDRETAEDLMSGEIAWVEADDTLLDTRETMLENNFSQMPVREEGVVVGSISETTMMQVRNADELVGEVLESRFPEAYLKTGRPVIEELLKDGNAAVLVKDNEEDYQGIITKADLI